MYLGMRINVDQNSPLELHKWTIGMDIKSTWTEMLGKLYQQHIESNNSTHKQQQASWRSGSVFGS